MLMFPNKSKCYKKINFRFWPFFGLFLAKKQPKLSKIEKDWQNPNRLMKSPEIWYVDASQQKKMLHKNCFSISAFVDLFVGQKAAKID